MKCFYINLDSAAERRISIKRSFEQNKKENWSLTRIPAFDGAYVSNNRIAGSLRPSEKACFLSHREAVRRSLEHDGPSFILEDDSVFGKKTCEFIDRIVSDTGNLEWDIIYTDVGIPNIPDMAELLRLKHQLGADEIRILDLKRLPFFAASAYILNAKSKNKLYALLSSEAHFELPYDLYLRKLVFDSTVKALVTFPFLTSVSELADASGNQESHTKETDLVWNLYRRMVWIDGNARKLKRPLRELEDRLSDEAKACGILWATMADKKFVRK